MPRPLRPGFQSVLLRELRRIARRPTLALMMGPLPVVLFLILTSVFHAGVPLGLPVAVVDRDGSQVSRQILRMIDATPDLDVTARLTDLSEARAELLAGRVYGIILVPERAERDLLEGAVPEVAIFYNNQMLTVGGIVSRAATGATAAYTAGLSVALREGRGQSADEAAAAVNPIPLRQSPLFNPALDYTRFLLAAVMPAVLQIFICASAVTAVASDRRALAPLVRRGGLVPAMAGKLAPYAVAFLVVLWIADAIVLGYFGAPFRGSIALHLAYTLAFVLACLGLGVLIGLITPDAAAGLGLAGLLTAPAFGFAGIGFPRAMMNGFSQFWGALLPLTPYLQLRTDQVVRGADVALSLPALGWLVALCGLYGGLAFLVLHRQARRPAGEAAA